MTLTDRMLQAAVMVRRRTPLVLQTEAAECGLACLAMLAGRYGHRVDLPALRFRNRRARRLPVRRTTKGRRQHLHRRIGAALRGDGHSGVDLDALIEVGRMAEEIVGHQLPSELIHAGSLDTFRRGAAA